jgi:hypothetical protein
VVMTEISGRVTVAGKPVEGLSVEASEHGIDRWKAEEFEAFTDARGFYRIPVPSDGLFDVEASRNPGGRSQDGVAAGATDVDFDLPEVGVMRLRLIELTSGMPVRITPNYRNNVFWRPVGTDAFQIERAHVDLDGRQDLTVEAGEYEVLVHLPDEGYVEHHVAAIRVPGDGVSEIVGVALERGSNVRLCFSGEGSSQRDLSRCALYVLEEAELGAIEGPLPERDARANERANGVWLRLGDPSLRAREARVDADGTAVIQSLRPGRYHLRVYPDDFVFEPAAFDLPTAAEGPIPISWRRR